MRIIVPVKRVASLDDEFVLADGEIDADDLEHDLNDWDRFSLQAALELLGDGDGEGEIVAITVGDADCEEQLRACLALGARPSRAGRVRRRGGHRRSARGRPPARRRRRPRERRTWCCAAPSPPTPSTGPRASRSPATSASRASRSSRQIERTAGGLIVDRELEGGVDRAPRARAPRPADGPDRRQRARVRDLASDQAGQGGTARHRRTGRARTRRRRARADGRRQPRQPRGAGAGRRRSDARRRRGRRSPRRSPRSSRRGCPHDRRAVRRRGPRGPAPRGVLRAGRRRGRAGARHGRVVTGGRGRSRRRRPRGQIDVEGVDEIVAVASPAEHFEAHISDAASGTLIAERRPAVVLLAHSIDGMGLGPALAARLELGFSSDVTAFDWDDGVQPREAPTAASSPLCRPWIRRPALLMLRPGAFPPASGPGSARRTRRRAAGRRGGAHAARRLRAARGGEVDITKSEILVSIGRGVDGPRRRAPVRRARGRARRDAQRLPAARRRRLGAEQPPGRPVRQHGQAQGLPGARDLRGRPAPRRHPRRRHDDRRQHRSGGADLRRRGLRRGRRARGDRRALAEHFG